MRFWMIRPRLSESEPRNHEEKTHVEGAYNAGKWNIFDIKQIEVAG